MSVQSPATVPKEFAEHLIEALPYIRRFRGSTVVIKYGGHAMTDPERKTDFCEDVVLLSYMGIKPVIVHGGGPMITHMLDRFGKEAEFINGLRITDAESLEVIEMVLVGQVRGDITSRINQAGGKAVGLSGRDGQLIVAEKHHEELFRELAANIDAGRVFAREEERVWKCLGCGYLHTGTEAPEKCPACVRKQGYFELLARNW